MEISSRTKSKNLYQAFIVNNRRIIYKIETHTGREREGERDMLKKVTHTKNIKKQFFK